MKKEVILMYSGGLDSILSCIRLVRDGFKVYLIHFDNVWAGNQFFYIKEGARFPDNSEMMDIEFSSILFGWNSASTQKNIVFKFKNAKALEIIGEK